MTNKEKINPGIKRTSTAPAKLLRNDNDLAYSEIVGCTAGAFRGHITRQLKQGMTLDNYGSTWQLFHIIPATEFDSEDPIAPHKYHHWSNLKPVWDSGCEPPFDPTAPRPDIDSLRGHSPRYSEINEHGFAVIDQPWKQN